VTYGRLGELTFGAAAELRDVIEHGDRVALLLENSPEYVSVYYGAWQAGGVAVGLNTALKAEGLAHLVRHCGARCLVADPRHRELARLRDLLGDDVTILERGPEGGAVATDGASTPELPPSPTPDELACLIYTSGTTGHPKGVMLSHRNIAANTESICEYLGIDEHERALCVLPFYYSYGASVLHTHLVAGASIVLENSFMYPQEVVQRLVDERATSFAGVPSTFYLLMRSADLSGYDLSSLRYVTQAGGRMEADQIRRFKELVPGTDFVVMYGQTEASARLAWVQPSELERKAGSAGQAIPGVEISIRDAAGDVLPPGEVGEICARGANVMMGYWADAEETASVLHDGWLHTGDLGHVDEDGYLFLVGRSREMIKSGAHRISPPEIEEVIRAIEGVRDVAVVGVEDEILGQVIKACVVPVAESDDLKRSIRRVCRERLPAFKIPKVIEFRPELPRTDSGKVQKHLL
jgi:acyl-CoA synthetase (AMP-forming)/AMP-acid ligase II